MRKTVITAIIIFLLLIFSGCRTSRDFNYIEDSIQKQISPARLDKEVKFSIGPLSMRMLNGLVDNDEEAGMYMKEIMAVQIGVYKVHNVDKSESFQIPGNVEETMIKKGWEPFVRVRKKNSENVVLFYRQLSKRKMSICVVALERDELSIVEVTGNLDNILSKAICEHRLAAVDKF